MTGIKEGVIEYKIMEYVKEAFDLGGCGPLIIKTICPKCKGKQNYQNLRININKGKKRCVFCNHTFKIYKNVNDHQIVEMTYSQNKSD